MGDKVRFSFLLRPGEVKALKRIAESMDRSQGAALRTLIRERAQELERAGLLAADPTLTPAHVADTLPTFSCLCSICQSCAAAGQQIERERSFPQRRRLRLLWGYLLAAVLLAALLFVGSLIMFPDWTRTNSSVLVLLVIVTNEVVQFVANWHMAFEVPPDSS
jgi:hypothetical protein